MREEEKDLLLEYYKWLDERGMLDNTLCYDPEHQTETFIELRERKRLPKTWEEFCEMTPIKLGEAYTNGGSEVYAANKGTRDADIDRNVLPDQETAEAVLALCQLIQLRECYNRGWQPDWVGKNVPDKQKYVIEFLGSNISTNSSHHFPSLLYFKTEELRDMFLNNFSELIEKLKPLYGVWKGGSDE